MIKFGLIGHLLGHSFSKEYFSRKFIAEDIDAEYLNFDIPEIGLLREVLAHNPTLRGLNVTIPYKQQIIPMLDSVEGQAAEIGAVNVVKINADGTLEGYNSDITGFSNSIKPLLKPWHTHALILGTGGASLAVACALRNMGIDYKFVSRTPSEGQLSYAGLDKNIMSTYKVIINATPLGTYPNVDGYPPIPYNLLNDKSLCFDLVYNPPLTEFLRQASARGATIINGLEMLHIQADESWKIWNNL